MNVGIFMNLKFRKYSHGGSYSEEELLLPDNTTLSTINIIYSSYRVYKKGDTEEFQSYGCEADIAEEEGYDPDEMEDSDWDKLWETVDESQYYNFTIEEFEGDDEEWEEYGGEIYGKDN